MEKKREATIVAWGFISIMEKKMETNINTGIAGTSNPFRTIKGT